MMIVMAGLLGAALLLYDQEEIPIENAGQAVHGVQRVQVVIHSPMFHVKHLPFIYGTRVMAYARFRLMA